MRYKPEAGRHDGESVLLPEPVSGPSFTLPTVCVVMPAYRSARTLRAAALSVLDQDYPESILGIAVRLDDTATRRVAESISDPKCRVIYVDRPGIGRARNAIIEAITADAYMFLDSDDLYSAGTVRAYAEDWQYYGGNVLRYSRWSAVSPVGCSVRQRHVFIPRRDPCKALVLDNYLATCTIMINASMLPVVGLFDESLHHGEDWDLWLRCVHRWGIRYVDSMSAYYTQTKLGTLRPRTFFVFAEDEIVHRHATGWSMKLLGRCMVRARYGLYYVRTLRRRTSIVLLRDVRVIDCALLPLAVVVKLRRYGWRGA